MLRTLACKRTSCNVFGIATIGRQSIQRSLQIQERRASLDNRFCKAFAEMRFTDGFTHDERAEITKLIQRSISTRESGDLSLPKREGSLLSAADVAVIKDTIREVLESQEAIRNENIAYMLKSQKAIRNENISYAVVVCAGILFFVYLNKPSTPAKAQEKDNAI